MASEATSGPGFSWSSRAAAHPKLSRLSTKRRCGSPLRGFRGKAPRRDPGGVLGAPTRPSQKTVCAEARPRRPCLLARSPGGGGPSFRRPGGGRRARGFLCGAYEFWASAHRPRKEREGKRSPGLGTRSPAQRPPPAPDPSGPSTWADGGGAFRPQAESGAAGRAGPGSPLGCGCGALSPGEGKRRERALWDPRSSAARGRAVHSAHSRRAWVPPPRGGPALRAYRKAWRRCAPLLPSVRGGPPRYPPGCAVPPQCRTRAGSGV
uniref:bcl-2-binding component 3-like n=1 Tax=Urocitellus parryii TaxID=9999 RepID=UPI000E560A40|nr:bcl-2-binding component 3-like [Urocitellus parryii]